jgi:hypothetical protein
MSAPIVRAACSALALMFLGACGRSTPTAQHPRVERSEVGHCAFCEKECRDPLFASCEAQGKRGDAQQSSDASDRSCSVFCETDTAS